MMSFLLVGLGGALGAMARYALGLGLPSFDPASGWPLATFAANLVGSVTIGILVAWLFASDQPIAAPWRLFLVVGMLGGFTTFSAFSLEAIQLFSAGRLGAAGLYVFVCALLLPLGCGLGWSVGWWIGRALP